VIITNAPTDLMFFGKCGGVSDSFTEDFNSEEEEEEELYHLIRAIE